MRLLSRNRLLVCNPVERRQSNRLRQVLFATIRLFPVQLLRLYWLALFPEFYNLTPAQPYLLTF